MDFNDLKIDQELNYSLSREEVNYFKEDNLEIKTLATNKVIFEKRPLNLSEILVFLGLNAEYKENVKNFVQLNRNTKTIEINKDDVDIKLKFYKIAVEIGKYVIDSNFGVSDSEARNIQNHIFAINLLMPYNETRNKILIGYTPDHLADYFNVSYEVAHYRYNYIVNRIV